MKQNYLKELMTALLLLCCTVAGAADFEVGGIYYNILSSEDKTVEVKSGSNEYTGAVTIPASVTYNDEAYSVKSIGNYAFYDCAGLTSIELPEGVTSIGNYAFCGCTGLTSVEIPSSVTSIGNAVFYDCAGLISIEIFANLTSIGSYVFIGCTGLTSVVSYIAAEDLFAINAGTFSGIDNDACTLYVPAGAKSTYAATNGWKKFTNIVEFNGKCGDNAYWALNEETGALTIFGEGAMYNYADNDANRAPWYSNKENIISVTIEEGVTSIGDYAFISCSGLTSIEIPGSVTSVENGAFGGCSGLVSIVVDENNTVYDSRGNCNAIIETESNTLIAGCKNTVIPNGVTTIVDMAFFGCTSLTSIEIPNSVTKIRSYAFYGCSSLESIEIPEGVTIIYDLAFCGCSSLESIEISSSVTIIDLCAFEDCTSLTSITSHIPADKLFALGHGAFNRIDKDACTLYVPAGAKSTYAATDGWKDFTNIVELEPEGYSLVVSAAGYATLYLGTAVEIPAGAEAYTANRIEGDYLKMQAVEDVIPANTAVIIKAEEGTYSFAYSDETPEAVDGNLLRGTLTDTYIKPASAQTAYVLSKVDGVVGMYRAKLKADGTFKNNANRVYMLLGEINVGEGDLDTSNPGGQLSNGFRFEFSGTTAIESVKTVSAAPAVYY
ncbi:MAG: leucine-rich repeat domain-containing protein, partial [Bacteroidaceae bacterium]|nr:leucine-rich repeat domain-containing protein [Bacteroidaceae bacterium]